MPRRCDGLPHGDATSCPGTLTPIAGADAIRRFWFPTTRGAAACLPNRQCCRSTR
jgi:hypothetical protein